MTYNHTLPNIKQLNQNHLFIWKTDKALGAPKPVNDFHENKSLKQVTGRNAIEYDKNIEKSNSKYEENLEYNHCVVHKHKAHIPR